MATKQFEQDNEYSCFNKAAPDEPLFILRAQDRTAPGLVIQWANRARKLGASEAKVGEALLIAKAMEAWPNRKDPD